MKACNFIAPLPLSFSVHAQEVSQWLRYFGVENDKIEAFQVFVRWFGGVKPPGKSKSIVWKAGKTEILHQNIGL